MRRAHHGIVSLVRMAALLGGGLGLALGVWSPGCRDGSPPGTDPCAGRQCGPAPEDPGRSCGTCPGATEVCSDEGLCVDLCAGRQCGPAPEDPGRSCGTCPGATEVCSDEGLCIDLCAGRECGEPAPGVSCGTCTAPEICGLPGRCFLPGTCPAGTVEVGLTGVCIDRYEVTVARMAEFLTVNGPECRPDWAYDPDGDYICGGDLYWDGSSRPSMVRLDTGEYVPVEGREDYPAVLVTYPGARMACQYFGGDLCTYEEWARACEGPEGHTYPYGDTYDATACNACNEAEFPDVCPPEPRRPEPVGSRPTCEGGYPGLMDMSGNVWEWVQDPVLGDEGFEAANAVGGDPQSGSRPAMCRSEWAHTAWVQIPYLSGPDLGFRCCYHLD